MKISAVLHFSALDYPDKFSAVLFSQGCPLRCVYCHNPQFQDSYLPGAVDFADVLAFLQKRVGLLEAVVFSGGEPLLQSDLGECMRQVKELGFLIGLHTSGAGYDNFVNILPLVDWVGFDIKAVFGKYPAIANVQADILKIKLSFNALISSGVSYEIRTTVDSRYISVNDLVEIAQFLRGAGVKKWVLQECILRHQAGEDRHLPLPAAEELEALRQYIDVSVRTA